MEAAGVEVLQDTPNAKPVQNQSGAGTGPLLSRSLLAYIVKRWTPPTAAQKYAIAESAVLPGSVPNSGLTPAIGQSPAS